jgi:hypothetical protein
MTAHDVEYIIKKGSEKALRPMLVHWLAQIDHILKKNSRVPLVCCTREKNKRGRCVSIVAL